MRVRRLLLAWIVWACIAPGAAWPAAPGYVGEAVCGSCHPAELARWRGSHHDLAMQPADADTVLGDFGGATLTHAGVTSRFFRRNGEAFVRTDGPEGALADFRIAYTFGVAPLQQYLVAFPDGRVQALPFAWDTRTASQGGQRWLHLYAGETLVAGDPLHWTGRNQTWNHMCGECHSTNFRKGYDPERDRYETTWSRIDVSCEACHGPGSEHAAWARRNPAEGGDPGLSVRFEAYASVGWATDPATQRPRRSPARAAHPAEIETCGRCHARRSTVHESTPRGQPLLDSHRPALLTPPLYFPDGQIRDEVYVYGSFLQSRMYAAGVRCSDCHDAHSGRLRAQGNALCGRCHEPARYDAAVHHHHPPGSPGAACVDCHMPARTYMVLDRRRDHGLRIPRPDLARRLGTPDACTGCHAGHGPAWAAEAIRSWTGRAPGPHWGEVLHAARGGERGAGRALEALLRDPAIPAIARATAFELLPRHAGPESLATLASGLRDPSPLVRTAALTASAALAPATRMELGAGLLADPVRSVRIEAARVLAALPAAWLTRDEAARRDAALKELRAMLRRDADRPEAWDQLGALERDLGRTAAARAAFERAGRLAPGFVPAAVNLADLHRLAGEEDEGEAVLREALRHHPEDGDLHHALGLLLVRRQQPDAALPELERAARARPEVARYAYVLAVALHSRGDVEAARRVLREAAQRHPGDPEIAAFLRQLTD